MDFDIIFDGFGHGFHINFSIVLIVQNPDALWVWASLVVASGMFLSVSLAVPKGGRCPLPSIPFFMVPESV